MDSGVSEVRVGCMKDFRYTTPETDPNGYELIHDSGFRLLHCGDSTL